MTREQARATTWGQPDHINYYSSSYAPEQWVYRRDGVTLYLYFRNGVVTSFQEFR